MTTLTKEMVGKAVSTLYARGYRLNRLPSRPGQVWLQAPGDAPGTPWWALYEMGRDEAWSLVWALYQQEVEA